MYAKGKGRTQSLALSRAIKARRSFLLDNNESRASLATTKGTTGKISSTAHPQKGSIFIL